MQSASSNPMGGPERKITLEETRANPMILFIETYNKELSKEPNVIMFSFPNLYDDQYYEETTPIIKKEIDKVNLKNYVALHISDNIDLIGKTAPEIYKFISSEIQNLINRFERLK